MKQKIESFKGKIKLICSSPYGEPEGAVLDDGTFIKIPPHSLIHAERIKIGASVSGEGEIIPSAANPVFHHVRFKVVKDLVANDQGTHHERKMLKEKHKKAISKMKELEFEEMTVRSRVEAIGVKPKGEVDRIILTDGTSVHLPKELHLDSSKIHVGNILNIEGVGKYFKSLKFMKASAVSNSNGKTLTE